MIEVGIENRKVLLVPTRNPVRLPGLPSIPLEGKSMDLSAQSIELQKFITRRIWDGDLVIAEDREEDNL